MSGSHASASVEFERLLVCGVNWLGDAVMTMPALQAFRASHPDTHITLLVKQGLRELWELHPAPDEIRTFESSWSGTLEAGRRLRNAYDSACVFPNSYRSALIPRLARIPRRRGVPVRGRGFLFNDTADRSGLAERHQACEYFRLLDLPVPDSIPPPALGVSEDCILQALKRLPGPDPVVALLPGAARGPAKRWPERHWLKLAQNLLDESEAALVCLGTATENELGDRIADLDRDRIANLAGQTSLSEFAALLHSCTAAVSNDSGGMHVASAVGTPVIAMFGITDPAKTGPLGDRAVVIQHSTERQRDLSRNSAAGLEAMAAIEPDEVLPHVLKRLKP